MDSGLAQFARATPTVGRPARWSPLRLRDAFWGYLFIAPSMLGVLMFTLFPVLAALGISFSEWNLITPPRFVGLEGYRALLSDPVFGKVLLNTLYYTAGSVPLNLVLSLALALALNQKIRGIAVYRTAYFMPVVSSMVAVGLIWAWLYDTDYGLINALLARLHLPPVAWLTSTEWAMPAVIVTSVWKSLGFNMVIFLAALQDVPEGLYEAARIDGAGAWRLFRHITLPLISPAVFFVVVMGIIGSFQAFDQVYVMTEGGPARATTVIVYYIWQNAFKFFKMGYASAMAYVLFLLVLLATLAQWQVRRRWVFGEM